MPRATTCLYDGKEISVNDAIEIKEATKAKERNELEFTCNECGERVRPHKVGGSMSAHLEHLVRNSC